MKTRVISILYTLLLMGRLYNKPCKQATILCFQLVNQNTMSLDDLAKTVQLEAEGWGAAESKPRQPSSANTGYQPHLHSKHVHT